MMVSAGNASSWLQGSRWGQLRDDLVVGTQRGRRGAKSPHGVRYDG
jgi:hypothetical protein